MNENTLIEKIAEVSAKLDNSFNGEEQAILSDELKELKKQLKAMKDKSNKKDVRLKTNIDAPIIGDPANLSGDHRSTSFLQGGNGTYVSML